MRATGVAILLLVTACSPPLQVDYYDFDCQKPLDIGQLIFRSSTIVVGNVRSVRTAREGVPARKLPELLLDEVIAGVDVENVILGNLKQRRLQFSYFTYSLNRMGGYSGPALLRVKPGQRRIFFLTTDSGRFRSVADVRGEYSIRVWSGLHNNCCEPVDQDDTRRSMQPRIGESIARLLLELGENYDRGGLIDWLDKQAYDASRLAGRRKIAALLQQLAANGHEPGIAAKACLVLSEQFYGQYDCLARWEADPAVPVSLRAELARVRIAILRWNARLKQRLKSYPLFAFEQSPFSGSIQGVREELWMLADSSDPELKSLACDTLRRNYPRPPKTCQ